MTTATFDPAAAGAAEHAVGYEGAQAIEPTGVPGFTCAERMANTGLYASAADMGRLLEVLLTPDRVLSQASLDALQGADHSPGWGPGWSYGYQTYGLDYKGVRVYHHYGASEGFNGGISWVPERGFGVVLLTNADEGAGFANVWGLEELRWWIVDRFLGLTGAPPDNATDPATWTQYEGTYVSTTDPAVSFTFALDAGSQVSVVVAPGPATPIPLVQGAIDVPYQGGDLFNHVGAASLLLAQFFPDAGGAMRTLSIYSTDVGGHVALRAP